MCWFKLNMRSQPETSGTHDDRIVARGQQRGITESTQAGCRVTAAERRGEFIDMALLGQAPNGQPTNMTPPIECGIGPTSFSSLEESSNIASMSAIIDFDKNGLPWSMPCPVCSWRAPTIEGEVSHVCPPLRSESCVHTFALIEMVLFGCSSTT